MQVHLWTKVEERNSDWISMKSKNISTTIGLLSYLIDDTEIQEYNPNAQLH